MIYGLGTDIVEIERIRAILQQPHGERFLQRTLTAAELDLAESRRGRLAEFAAGRFAAKEAVVKAFGCGIGALVGLQDMTIVPDKLGKPQCILSGAALERLGFADKPPKIHLSISHSVEWATATCIVET